MIVLPFVIELEWKALAERQGLTEWNYFGKVRRRTHKAREHRGGVKSVCTVNRSPPTCVLLLFLTENYTVY